MIINLFEDIQKHLCMLDLALASSIKISQFTKQENLDLVSLEVDNRERLVNIIGKIQLEIEDKINKFEAGALSNNDIQILKTWFQDLHIWSEKMNTWDQATVDILAQQKENTTQEIAHVFKSKEMFKGYNLNMKK